MKFKKLILSLCIAAMLVLGAAGAFIGSNFSKPLETSRGGVLTTQ